MADIDPAVQAAREKLKERLGGASRIGGKGTARRPKKAPHKSGSTDDKKLQSTLKRIGVNTIPGIEEVNIIKEDGNMIHFTAPKVQASIPANTYVISGDAETKPYTPDLSSLLSSFTPQQLKALTEQFAKSGLGGAAGAGGDDEMPELQSDFESAAQ